MPTGYTAAVADGEITELEPFIMHLARGMGALVTMRDAPHDAPIPEAFEPHTKYHDDALAEARAERDRLYAMSSAEADAAANEDWRNWDERRRKDEAEHGRKRDRYNAMIAKVEAWESAPEGIKEFALDQLRQSIEFDCREPYQFYSPEPTTVGSEWRKEKLEKLARDIERHTKMRAEEIARVEGRNAWLAQLRRSLKSEGKS